MNEEVLRTIELEWEEKFARSPNGCFIWKVTPAEHMNVLEHCRTLLEVIINMHNEYCRRWAMIVPDCIHIGEYGHTVLQILSEYRAKRLGYATPTLSNRWYIIKHDDPEFLSVSTSNGSNEIKGLVLLR